MYGIIFFANLQLISNENAEKSLKNEKKALTIKSNAVRLTVVADMRMKGGWKDLVNVNKLKGKIVECGLNISILADEIGIDKATLYRKIRENGDPITIREADKISEALNLSKEEVNDIFFSQYVA